jgi:multidrug transporter EmrE-like cation transporter
MNTPLLFLIAAVLLTVAGYAQYRIPLHTASRSKASLTRGILALVGLAFGYLCTSYADTPVNALFAFLSGFGLVHLPAAIILFLKRARGEGKS